MRYFETDFTFLFWCNAAIVLDAFLFNENRSLQMLKVFQVYIDYIPGNNYTCASFLVPDKVTYYC